MSVQKKPENVARAESRETFKRAGAEEKILAALTRTELAGKIVSLRAQLKHTSGAAERVALQDQLEAAERELQAMDTDAN